MAKKRKREQVQLYDHSAYRHEATASVVDYSYRRGTIQLKTRAVNVTPIADPIPPRPSHTVDDDAQEIREDDVGLVVMARTRSKRYVNSVSQLSLYTFHRSLTAL